jgi:hypothetical protein
VALKWGPWSAEASSLTVHGRGDNRCTFAADAVYVRQNGEAAEHRWADIYEIQMAMPAYPLGLWWLLAPLFLMVPAAIEEPREVYVHIACYAETHHAQLGRPEDAPFPLRCRSASAVLFSALAPGELQGLLAAEKGMALLEAMRSTAHVRLGRSETLLRRRLASLGVGQGEPPIR